MVHPAASIGDVIARVPGVVAAWLIGSVARGEATRTSDLDLAVLMQGPSGCTEEAALRALTLELERHAPSGRVDIVVLGAQGSVFRHRVLREGRLVLDRDPEARHAFEARTIAEYLDWRTTHQIAMASVFEGLRRRFVGPRR